MRQFDSLWRKAKPLALQRGSLGVGLIHPDTNVMSWNAFLCAIVPLTSKLSLPLSLFFSIDPAYMLSFLSNLNDAICMYRQMTSGSRVDLIKPDKIISDKLPPKKNQITQSSRTIKINLQSYQLISKQRKPSKREQFGHSHFRDERQSEELI